MIVLGCGGVGIICVFGSLVKIVVEYIIGCCFKICYVDYVLFKSLSGE